MSQPLRKTRRRMAYGLMIQISLVVLWMLFPGDIGEKEQALAMVIVPALITGLVAFITGETYSDHSHRVNTDA
ncbi:MAG: hypothetical protein GY942_19570 [Aestuariibacter sp.]|nr:hypothetical protein [Aestuariibacter sp.]